MEVYVEYALAENFCMDFFVLFAAKAATKNAAGARRIALASCAGAVFAVLFPLAGLNGWLAAAVKILSGGLMCLAAGTFARIRDYVKFSLVFAGLTFALGGALIAIFSLADIEYDAGRGFILSSVPVGIPLFAALAMCAAAKKLASRFVRTTAKCAVICRIYAGQCHITLPAFFDSGNRVYRFGSPVCVISKSGASKLTDISRIKDSVTVHTVAGDKNLPLFTADKVEIDYGKKVITHRGVLFCISDGAMGRAVLHPDLAEAKL